MPVTRSGQPWRSPGRRSDADGPCEVAVCVHHDQPLPVRPDHDRARVSDRTAADRLAPPPAAGVSAADQVLRHAACDQRRDRRGDGPRAGVRVRHELVVILTTGRQYLRRAARNGRTGGLLPRVDVPGVVVVRLGQAFPPGSSHDNLAGRIRIGAISAVHHGGKLLDAASGRLRHQSQDAFAGAERHLGAVHQPGVPVGVRQGYLRGPDHGSGGDAGGVGLAAAQGRGSRGLRQVGAAGSGRIGPGDPAGHAGRRRTRGDRGPVPADEDRRGGGPVDHLPAVLILAVPDRRRQQRPHPDSDPGNPAPAIASCHQPLERQGHRPDAAAEPILRQVRIRLLRAERLHPVLVHAGDGLPGPDRDRGRALGPVAQPAQEAGDVQAVPLGRAVGGRAAVPDEYGGLAADRVRPAAVDRAGHHADQERAVPVGQHYLPGDQPDRVRAALRGSRHCRLAADAALLAQGTAARARAGLPDQPVPAMEY